MPILVIDFETRSTCNIRYGAHRYAEDHSTEVMCLATGFKGETLLWTSEKFEELLGGESLPVELKIFERDWEQLSSMVQEASKVVAHNVAFEQAMWANHLLQYGVVDLPLNKLYDTSSMAVRVGLPADLDRTSNILGLAEVKDKAGHRLMLKMCKPRTPRKAEKYADPDWEHHIYWHETPEQLRDLFTYCVQDIKTTELMYDKLKSIGALSTPTEREVWELDNRINNRGVYVDTDLATFLDVKADEYKRHISDELERKYGFTPSQVGEMLKFVKSKSSKPEAIKDLTADTVTKLLKVKGLPEEVREVLQTRKDYSKSSVSKFSAMVGASCKDSRIRGTLKYYGAATGRWAGRLIQPQNFPRETFDEEGLQIFREALNQGIADLLYLSQMEAFSQCLRCMLSSPEGYQLMCADFASIEGRVLAWLAGERTTIKAYIEGKDMYKIVASGIYDVKYEDVDKSQRQTGKVAELALGYQGGWRALQAMAKNYGLNIPKEEGQEIVRAWRENRPLTVKFWSELNDAAINVMRREGSVARVGHLMLTYKEGSLLVRLPSQRVIHYPFARIVDGDFGGKQVMYKKVVTGNQWVDTRTYGGKLVENAVQAVARDLMAEAMLRLDKAGFNITMSIHDEAVAEVKEEQATEEEYKKFCGIMCEVPAWAEGVPIEVDGWVGKRYKK